MVSQCIRDYKLIVGCVILLCFIICFSLLNGDDNRTILRKLTDNVVWGVSFPGVHSDNIVTDCQFAGYPICCAAVADVKKTEMTVMSSDRNNSSLRHAHHHTHSHCDIKRVYIPSPYETTHIEVSNRINQMPNEGDRRKAYINFLFAQNETDAAKRWLARVKIHGSTDHSPVITSDDYELMSRFEVTRTCPHVSAGGMHSNVSVSWLEWIEPLSIHARHPFALGQCPQLNGLGFRAQAHHKANNLPSHNLQQNEYVLVQSAASQYNNTVRGTSQRSRKPVRQFMLDAGTSTFDSSLYWFVCAYLQRGMAFDQIFGWEMTLLDPRVFWSKVPPRYKSIYHFFNVPVQKASNDSDSPLHVIMTEATRDDFVSFKLDIDTPEVEIPIALQIANDPELAALIDEFFFELHFRCEFLMVCGWGYDIAREVNGLIMDRPHALELMHKMRKLGIRAHFWP